MRSINPGLFARVMRLPDAARADILEFIGATPVGEAHLAAMIDAIAERFSSERRPARIELS